MHGSVHVHMVYSVRAKLAVRITARFADPRRFCPSVGHRDAHLSDDCRASVGWGFAVLLALGGGLVLLVPRRAAGSARAIPPGLSRAPVTGRVAAAGVGDRHGAVARGSVC